MARVVDAKYSTFVGTAEEIRRAIELLAGLKGAKGAAVVDLKFSNFVVLREPPGDEVVTRALATTPGKQRTR